MVMLVTVQQVRDRMALDPQLIGVNPTIESAIRAAHLRIRTEYDSELQKRSNVDTFWLDSVIHNGVRPGGMFRLYLNHAFTRVAPAVKVEAGSTIGELAEIGDFQIDRERGIVYVPERYEDQFVRITYDSGFGTGEENSAPEWLKEAILAYVPVVFNFSNPANNDPKQEKMNRQSGDHALAIVAPYKRNIGFCIRPAY